MPRTRTSFSRRPGSGSPSGPTPPGPGSLTPAQRLAVISEIEGYQRLATQASRQGLLNYLHFVSIDSSPSPMPFRDRAEDWQWAQARTLAPAIEQAAGLRTDYDGPRRFWLEYPRGHDKSSSIGRYLNWVLGFGPRQNIRCQAAASDQSQAGMIADCMKKEQAINPWLGGLIRPQRFQFDGARNDARLTIMAADAAGSYGSIPDVLVCDELTHWPKSDLWDALYSGMEKRPHSVTVVITNSGIKNTWQEKVLKAAKRDPTWLVYQAPGPISRWMDAERIKNLANSLPKGVGRRVLYNQWVDPGEECGLCTRDEAERCEVLGRRLRLERRHKGQEGVRYVAAVDYGLTRDRTALVVMHVAADGCYVVDKLDVWQGAPGAPVQADDVQLWVEQTWRNFKCHFVFDPHQLEPVAQRLAHLPIERLNYRGGQTNCQMAGVLLNLLRNGRLAWYAGAGEVPGEYGPHTLADEFAEVVVKTMPYGFRVDHETGLHDDRVTAVGMAALKLTELGPSAGLAVIDESYF